jgi:hypothetical protein
MSIYRDQIYSDVHANQIIRQVFGRQPELTQVRVEEETHKHLRKAAPADKPLPATLTWVANLPAHVRPTTLLRDFARIANLIATTWGDSKESLLADKRGNRRGFPADVLKELVALALNHT